MFTLCNDTISCNCLPRKATRKSVMKEKMKKNFSYNFNIILNAAPSSSKVEEFNDFISGKRLLILYYSHSAPVHIHFSSFLFVVVPRRRTKNKALDHWFVMSDNVKKNKKENILNYFSLSLAPLLQSAMKQ